MASAEMERLIAYRQGLLETDVDAPISTGGASISESDLSDATEMLIQKYGSGEEVLNQMIETGNPENVHEEYCSLAGIGAETIDEVWSILNCQALTGGE